MPKKITLKEFVDTHVDFEALKHTTTIKAEAGRLLEAAKVEGIKSTLGSVAQSVSQAYKAHRKAPRAKAKATVSRPSGRSLAKDEIMRLAKIGAEQDLAFHLRMVETLRIFLKGV